MAPNKSVILALLGALGTAADDVSCANQEDGLCAPIAANVMLQKERALIKKHTSSGPVSITLGQDVNWPPYAYKDSETGEVKGFGKDVAMGMNALCPDELKINVVETRWDNCWSSANGGQLGEKLDDETLDGCMTYTHTQGLRNDFADFSWGILSVNKAAGLLTLLHPDGTPKVDGADDLEGKNIVDVGGWAPTADGVGYVTNKCTDQPYSKNFTLLTGDGNDDSMRMLRDGRADVMFVYSDQAHNYQCGHGVDSTWNCSLWEGFGTEYAYVQTGQFGILRNGTTLVLTKKGSGVNTLVNSCLQRFMETKEYYDVCVKNHFESTCYPNSHFPVDESSYLGDYLKPTDEHTGGCSGGYCSCPNAADSA